MTPELVLLDLDGTLTDSAPGIIESIRYGYAALDLPTPDDEALRSFVGPPMTESLLRHGVPQERLQEAVTAYRKAFVAGGMFNNSVYDGVIEALTRLRAAGIRLALATSKPEIYAVQITERFGLAPFLEGEFGAGPDGGARSTKAAVIAYGLDALARSDRGLPDASRILMVGDRLHDVHGARANDLDCVGVSWGYAGPGELMDAGAIAVVDSPRELVDHILK